MLVRPQLALLLLDTGDRQSDRQPSRHSSRTRLELRLESQFGHTQGRTRVRPPPMTETLRVGRSEERGEGMYNVKLWRVLFEWGINLKNPQQAGFLVNPD